MSIRAEDPESPPFSLHDLRTRLRAVESGPIAIVGAGLRLPGGVDSLDGYWSLLVEGRDAVRDVPPDRWDAGAWTDPDPDAPGKMRGQRAGFLDDIAHFDAAFFGISPREALELDPAQRLLLEVAWEALESAAIAPDRLDRSPTGVYVGLGLSDYGRRHFLGPDPTRMTAYSGTGSFLSVAAGRISYTLGLQGPAMTVDTACSASLVAVHLAVDALRRGEVDLALAGGANVICSPEPSVYFSKLQATSPDGRCKTFDAAADGYGRGEGAAVVALKRLPDAIAAGDPILAVIRGTAVNHDGRSNGLTAPNGAAQQAVVRQALANAGIDPDLVGYIEAHGTGTPLGDPIEVDALRAVFGDRPSDRPLRIGSVKTNFGHLETAAGVAGLLKLALCVQRGAIPPHLHLRTLNPRIRLGTLQIPTETVPWTGDGRVGGVSGFGLSGTNAHVVVEQAPAPGAGATEESRPIEIVTLSARSEPALAALAERWAAAVPGRPLAEAARTSVVGRAALPARVAVIARDEAEAAARLGAFARGEADDGVVRGTARGSLAPPVVFLLTGQGAQHAGMGRRLYETEPAFREALDACFEAVDPLVGRPLREVLWGRGSEIDRTGWTQPALFALEVALARFWERHGVEPEALLGHSVGEIVAAHLAGVLSLEDAATLVVERGRLMEALPAGGAMASIEAPEAEVAAAVNPHRDRVDVAGVNSPSDTVISGDAEVVDAIAGSFEARGVRVRRLTVSHAFHSPRMDPMLDGFEALARTLTYHPPKIPVVSNLDGQDAGARLQDPRYWRQHVRRAVRFADGVNTLLNDDLTLFLELGPRPVLSAMGARTAGDRKARFVATLHPDRDDQEQIARAMATLWTLGVPVDLRARVGGGRRAVMPTMPWRGERYWLEATASAPPAAGVAPLPLLEIAWTPAPAPRHRARGRWRVVGDPDLADALRARGAELAGDTGPGDRVVVVAGTGSATGEAWRAAAEARDAIRAGARVHFVARTAEHPQTAALRGLGRVIAAEAPDRWGGLVDVHGAPADEVAGALLADDGEDLVRVVPGERRAARLVEATGADAGFTVPTEGAILVTGGFGALGRALARELAALGAKRLVLAGRSGAASAEAKALMAELKDRGVEVEARKADVSTRKGLKALLAKVPDLAGVVHAAGIADDGLLRDQTEDRFAAVLGAKAEAALLLDELTADRELALFVLVSSVSGWTGVIGQASYAAANAVLDAVAESRRARGRPAVSVVLGPVDGLGLAAGLSPEVRERWAADGIRPLQPGAAMEAFRRAAGGTAPVVCAAPFAWDVWSAARASRLAAALVPAAAAAATTTTTALVDALEGAPSGARRAMLVDHVRLTASRVLGMPPDRRIDPTEGFFDAGMDSLMAVELRDRLQTATGRPLPAALVFDHPTVEALADALLSLLALDGAPEVASAAAPAPAPFDEPVAIVGIACRMPGSANDPEALWGVYRDGVDAICPVPRDRFDVERYFDPTPGTPGRLYVREGGFIDEIDRFDAAFFGISPREATSLDPQQRLLLECSWHALEDAAIPADRLRGRPVGVYVGIGPAEYWLRFDPTVDEVDAYAGTGNETSFAAGRVSYVLGLQGPSMSVNTACSSSLVSVHLAVQALRRGQCELALAGGVNAIVGPENTIWMSMLQALAPDARCKAFDERADGYVRAEGCGMVVLKRLSDAVRDGDRIHAVIRGSAIDHDGASSGLTVPNGLAQQRVIRDALADAGVSADSIGYLECHGTGTRLGDPIEVEALGTVLAAGRPADRPLWLGAAKANHGHLEAGAGIAGLLRAVLALKHRTIPPIAHLRTPNPALPLDRFPAIRLPTAPAPWDGGDGPRRAGVSSFGISGTNAHLVLEEAPVPTPPPDRAPAPVRPVTLLTVSGRSEAQVRAHAGQLAAVDLPLADLAYSLNRGRAHGPHRATVVAADLDQARAQLRALADGSGEVGAATTGRPRVVFLCTGAGPQAFGMARALADVDPVFRDALHAAAAAADPHLDRPLLEVIYPADAAAEADSPLHDLAYTQPAMFAIEWATAALWRSWGIEPAAVIGHSTGQYVAAALAGVFDLATGMALMAKRARLMSDQPKIGGMVACFAPEARVAGLLAGHEADASFAAINGPAETVISGRDEVVESVARRIEAEGIEIRRLNISHAAHSPLMDPILDAFERMVGEVALSRPAIPLVENVRGEVAGDEVTTARYWRDHMREPVRFFQGMRTLVDQGFRVFLEIGNHPVLAGAGARCVEDIDDAVFLPSMRRDRADWEQMLETAGALVRLGATLDWDGFHAGAPGKRVALPPTPFQRKRFWVDRPERAGSRVVGQDWTVTPTWTPVRPNVDAFGSRGTKPILILADAGGIGAALAARQERRAVVTVPGDGYALDRDRATVDPADPEQIERLVREVGPAHVVHLWALDAPAADEAASAVEAALPAVRSAAFALRAAAQARAEAVWLVTRGAAGLDGEVPALSQAPVIGLGNAAAVELGDLGVVRIDLDPSPEATPDDHLRHLEVALNSGSREEQLAIRGGRHLARRLAPVPAVGAAGPPIRDDPTYLVTGGLGAIGVRVARWLLGNGAGAVVLTSRRDRPDLAPVLEGLGERAAVILGDVAEPGAVARILDEAAARGLPPVRGVFHAAGVLDDGWLADLGPDRWAGVLRPKLDGALALHRALPDAELFVLFSSAASLVGNPGQANYAAGNAFLDALAQARRAAGRHAASLCWGPWADEGLAHDASRQWERSGVRPLAPSLAIEVMAQRLGGPEPVVGVLDIDWRRWADAVPRAPAAVGPLVSRAEPAASEPAETRRSAIDALRQAPAHRRREALAALVAGEVGAILGQAAGEVDPRVGFFDAGMDSLMAVELSKRLKHRLGRPLPATLAFDHPNVEVLTTWLYAELGLDDAPAPAPAPVAAVPAERRIDTDAPIAVVGMSCRMPGGANDPEAFWALLRSGRDPIAEVPPERWDIASYYDPTPGVPGKMYVREAGWVDRDLVEGFDPEFFGISHREAEICDPQQRMLLEVSYEALERAGLTTPRLERSRTGVFVGVGSSGFLQRFQAPGGPLYQDQYAGTGSLEAFVSGRVAYALGLHGPNLALNTACSSALVAIHLACQALRAGDAEQCLAGGVHLMLSPENFVYVSQIRALSPDGRCKTFDASADGYGRAEGCGMVVLKRLDDALRDGDPVLAVIRGTAIGHDGPSSGLTVPYGPAQVQVLSEAVARAGIDPLDVSYLEAHGTGTVLGDPIEVHAAEEVYCRGRTADNPLHIGAVKSNVGHLEVAAGAASVIKMVLALQHREIPPHLHFRAPNPDLDLDAAHMVVDTGPVPWTSPRGPLRCGISGFGLAGTNVHLVLEEPPPPPARPRAERPERDLHLLPLSARSPEALRDLARRFSDRLGEGGDLADVAFSAATTRIPYERRLALVAPDARAAVDQLRAFVDDGEAPLVTTGTAEPRPPRVVFLFSGQGAQVPGMGRELYATWPVFRETVDRCAEVLDPLLPRPIREVMFEDADSDDAAIHDTAFTQPALFVLEVALAALWRSWGVTPAAVLGHSIGQIAAATVAGVLSLEDGLRLVAERGRLMGALPRDGAMAAVFADESAVRDAIAGRTDDVAIAAVNNPGEVTISGRTEAVDAVLAALTAEGIQSRRLVVSHAFHSPLMAPMLEAFHQAAAKAVYRPPEIPVVCNKTGGWATEQDLRDPGYWRDLVRAPVRFADGLQLLGDEGFTVFVEVGPHTALLGMGRRTLPDRRIAWLPSLQRGEPAHTRLLPTLGALWCRGVRVDWAAYDAPWPRSRVSLPTYPWQRRRIWPDLPEFPGQQAAGADWLVAMSYEDRSPAVGAVGAAWRVIGTGPLAARVRQALTARGGRVVEVLEPGVEAAGIVVVPAVPEDLGADPTLPAVQLLEAVQPLAGSTPLTVVTEGAMPDGAPMRPLAATLWGLGRVIRAERPELEPVLIDVDDVSDDDALIDAIAATDREPEVVVRAGRRRVGRLARAGFAGATPALADGTVLVTGGLGGLGLEAAAWLAAHGATHLVLTGRSAPSPDAEARIEAMRRGGTAVVVDRGDVADPADVERIVGAIAARGETLIGVVHAAGVLADASLARLDAAAFRKVFAPKVAGTWNLHRATEGAPLRFFVLFAAGAGLLGAPGQGNYAAANAFQDAFAHWRRSRGLPAVAVDWGAWAEVGMAARVGGLLERQAEEGVRPIPLQTGLAVMGRLLGHPGPQVGVLHVDWNRLVDTVHRGVCPPLYANLARGASSRPEARGGAAAAPVAGGGLPALLAALEGQPRERWDGIVEDHVHDRAVRILRLPRDRVLDRDVPLLELGLDSLTAVELKNAIMDDGVDIPVARVMTGPSVRQIAIMVRQALEADGATALSPTPGAAAAGEAEAPPLSPAATHLMAFGFGLFVMVAIVMAYLVSVQVLEPRANLADDAEPAAFAPPGEAKAPAGKAKAKRKAKAQK